jgi:hypothetical protein
VLRLAINVFNPNLLCIFNRLAQRYRKYIYLQVSERYAKNGPLVGLLMYHLAGGAVMFLFLRRLGPGQARAVGRPAAQGGGL